MVTSLECCASPATTRLLLVYLRQSRNAQGESSAFELPDMHPFASQVRVLRELRELLGYGSLLRELVARDLKVRYKRSVLGVVWTMLNPLFLMIILAFVFSHILRMTVEHFPVYLLSALVLWTFFSQATSWSTACFLSYAAIIKRVYVPRSIFVIATIVSGVVNLLISLVPLALIMLIIGHRFSPALVFLPVPILLTALFSLGISLALAPLSLMFADIVPIYQVVLSAWIYVTPVIYPLTALPDAYRRDAGAESHDPPRGGVPHAHLPG